MSIQAIRTFGTATVVAALVVLAGCSPSSGAPADLLGVPDGVSLEQLHQRPPIHRMTASAAAVRIDRAKQRLITECMARHGFTYAAAPTNSNANAANRLYRFGLERLPDRSATHDEPVARETPQDKAFGRALYGDPDQVVTANGDGLSVSRPANGCMAEADKRLLGPDRIRWMRLTISLYQADAAAMRRLASDGRFEAAARAWRTCMKRAGFNASSPQKLAGDLADDTPAKAVPMAEADLRCKQETRYLIVGYTRLADLQQRLLDNDPDVFQAWKTLQHRQDTQAGAVLSS